MKGKRKKKEVIKKVEHTKIQCSSCRKVIGYKDPKGNITYNGYTTHYTCDICGSEICENCKTLFERDKLNRCEKCFIKQLGREKVG